MTDEFPHFNSNYKSFENKIIAFVVVDSGVGISAERLSQISKLQIKTDNLASNFDGTGVGLSIVINYIENIENIGLIYNSTQGKTYFAIYIQIEGNKENTLLPESQNQKQKQKQNNKTIDSDLDLVKQSPLIDNDKRKTDDSSKNNLIMNKKEKKEKNLDLSK